MPRPIKVEISHKTIIFAVFFGIFLVLLYQARYVILLFFIAVIFMSALSPLVDRLEKLKIPRGVAILFFYLLIWGLISYGIASLVPPLIEQSNKFISRLPQTVESFNNGNFDISFFQSQISSLPKNIFKFILGAFNNVIAVFTLMVVIFYLIIERKNLKKYLVFLFGDGDREKHAEAFINNVEHKLGGWVRGQLILMIIVGIMSYCGLTFLGVEFAIPLAFLAGLLEIIPNVGPTISMIPAILVALATSPVLAIAVFGLYIIIQQLENNIIVPKVMQKVVGLSPLVTILALLSGFKIAGIAGAVLSVPTVLILEIAINEFYRQHKH